MLTVTEIDRVMPLAATLFKGLWPILSSVVTWFIVIVGWMVLADQQNTRELRKDRAARLSTIRDNLDKIEALAIEFHTSASFNAAQFFALARGISALQRELDLLHMCGFTNTGFDDLIVELRRACTAVNADKSSFQQQDHYGDLVGNISFAARQIDDRLIESLTAAFSHSKSAVQSVVDILRPWHEVLSRWWRGVMSRSGWNKR